MLFPSRTTLFVFASTLLFCATAVELCGKYTNNCANLKYENQNLIFFKNETDSIYQAQLLYYEYMKKDCSESPILLVTESYELDSSQNTLIEKDRGITVFNETAFDYYIECDTELEPNRYYSLSSLFCFYKHIDTFYIGLEENMHKMIELNAISNSNGYITFKGTHFYYFGDEGCNRNGHIFQWIFSIIILFFILISILASWLAFYTHKKRKLQAEQQQSLLSGSSTPADNPVVSSKPKSKIHINPSIISV